MNGTVAPPSSRSTAAATWLSRTPSSAAIREMMLIGPSWLTRYSCEPTGLSPPGSAGRGGLPVRSPGGKFDWRVRAAQYSGRMTAYQRPRTAAIPDKPVLNGLEAVWSVRWEAEQVYRFD